MEPEVRWPQTPHSSGGGGARQIPQPSPVPSLADDVFAALLSLLETGRCGRRPVLALNGPVGAGKSTLVRTLAGRAADCGLRLAVASIDDLYLPLAERRQRLAGNPFGVSRVPPGSHDVALLLERLSAWRNGGPLVLPCFDKRLADGEGDRCGEQRLEAEALLLEGWLLGCQALGASRLDEELQSCLARWPLEAEECRWLPRWDQELSAYQPLWNACDGLWVLRPQRWSLPRRWRFQAEARQRRGGGGSLAPTALDRLVRASLHALPPPLYQDPLVSPGRASRGAIPLLGFHVLDGRRRPIEASSEQDHSSLSSASSAIG